MTTLTIGQQLAALPEQTFLTIQKIVPSGALQARRLSTGAVQFYWRYSLYGGTKREPIGVYDSTAAPKSVTPTDKGYSVVAAARAASTLAMTHHANMSAGGLPSVREEERAAVAVKKAERAAAEQAAESAAEYTFARLLREYVNTLQNKTTNYNAWSILRLHVIEPFPALAGKPANQVRDEDFVPVLRRLKDKGKYTTAKHLRAYASAAFNLAIRSRLDTDIPEVFTKFKVGTVNPVATLPAEGATPADKRPLTLAELRLYWQILHEPTTWAGPLLRLHLLTGGQRITQFVKLKNADVRPDSITLYDPKGAKDERGVSVPREHPIPLTERAKRELDAAQSPGEYSFRSLKGNSNPHLFPPGLSKMAAVLVNGRIKDFSLKRVRSTVETVLAQAGVSSDHRGKLQSHGVSGVQDKHYNAWQYMPERLEALEILEDWLVSTPEVLLEAERKARRDERLARREHLAVVPLKAA